MAKCYYNGVLLPEIPADVPSDCVYNFIRADGTNARYDLVVSPYPWCYVPNGDSGQYFMLTKGNEEPVSRYILNYADVETAEEWTFFSESTKPFSIEENRPLLWSSEDIPDGSLDSETIYFYGSEPIPEEVVPEAPEVIYRISSTRLTEIADAIRSKTGKTEPLMVSQFAEEIAGIQSGS